MMKTLRNSTALGAGAALLTLLVTTPAHAASAENRGPKTILPSGHAMHMSQFYTGTVGATGEFRGRLLCIRMTRDPIEAPTDRCDKKEHVYVLAMQGSMVHPLLAGDPQTFKELPRLVGKKVVVEGRYYEDIGMVVAGNIRTGT
jgi:hypothetical protein